MNDAGRCVGHILNEGFPSADLVQGGKVEDLTAESGFRRGRGHHTVGATRGGDGQCFVDEQRWSDVLLLAVQARRAAINAWARVLLDCASRFCSVSPLRRSMATSVFPRSPDSAVCFEEAVLAVNDVAGKEDRIDFSADGFVNERRPGVAWRILLGPLRRHSAEGSAEVQICCGE
ncbi:MAG: hypothetical protein ACI8W8_001686 [Rhodothermales bacterium]